MPFDFRKRNETQMNIRTDLKAQNLGKPAVGRSTARLVKNGRVFIAGVCLHDTAGSGTHNDTLYLANPGDGRAVSCDFTVERDGEIYQLNPDLERFYTFHAGRATKFQAADGSRYINRDVTRVLIGIELVQKAKMTLAPVWPADQVQAAAELCYFLAETFKFGKDQITTHQRIITDGSRTDPRAFPFTEFWHFFNKAAAGPALNPNPSGPLNSPVLHTVAAGDTLSALARKYNTSIEGIKAANDINQRSDLIKIGQVLVIRR
jgi:LysM repeat protein